LSWFKCVGGYLRKIRDYINAETRCRVTKVMKSLMPYFQEKPLSFR
jgi:hypothetical protein